MILLSLLDKSASGIKALPQRTPRKRGVANLDQITKKVTV
jgi:hypothetical protein